MRYRLQQLHLCQFLYLCIDAEIIRGSLLMATRIKSVNDYNEWQWEIDKRDIKFTKKIIVGTRYTKNVQ